MVLNYACSLIYYDRSHYASCFWQTTRRPRRPRMRRCLLKGCEERFRPRQVRQRYCGKQCREEARKWYRQAVAWTEKHRPRDEELRRFRGEAADLLGVKAE